MKMFGVEIIPLKFDYNCVNRSDNRCSERYIEIPIALSFIQNIVKDEPFTEFGCTCPYYFETLPNHIVYDLTDRHRDNIKKDIRTLDDSEYKTNIVSISTLEHINQRQYGIRTIDKDSFSAISVLKKIAANALKYLVTVPIGQNADLDKFLIETDTELNKAFVGRTPLKTDHWDIVPKGDVVGEYRKDNTYRNANCICVISNSL